MKPLLFVLMILFYSNSFAQVPVGSQTNTTIKLTQDIVFNDPSNNITIDNANIETTGNISFGNAAVILRNSFIKCRNFNLAGVTTLTISDKVDIRCAILAFPLAAVAPAPATTITPTRGNSIAEWNISYTGTIQNDTNYRLPANFSVSILRLNQ